MQRKLHPLSWTDFDAAAGALALAVEPGASGVYGEPRGGLPLAVALSHRLGLPLLAHMSPEMIWVDDIVDSGQTLLARRRLFPHAQFLTWVTRKWRPDVEAAQVIPAGWIVFPWEDAQKAAQDCNAYVASRATGEAAHALSC
jgi:hypoxanthine phosphoribosyltransferase